VLQDDAADGVLSGEELERGSVVAVWGVLAAILLLTLLVYTGSLNNEFVHDDWPSVSENQHLRDLGNLDDFFLDPGLFSKTGRSRHTRPVLLVTFALNYAFGSESTSSCRSCSCGGSSPAVCPGARRSSSVCSLQVSSPCTR
jgi:hypothetical protein